MGSVGDCYDNSMAESFFATLERELLNIVQPFKRDAEAETAVFDYIEGFYNKRRRHSRLHHIWLVQIETTMPG